jgi:hypothetical protein
VEKLKFTPFITLAVRLVNDDVIHQNNSDHYGVVEIYHGGKWWKLYDNRWSIADANVVCHYLGYDRASEIYHEKFTRTNAPVLSIDFECHGNEGQLAECLRKEQKRNTSNNERGSGVRCIVDGKIF